MSASTRKSMRSGPTGLMRALRPAAGEAGDLAPSSAPAPRPATADALLSLRNLRKTFGAFVAVENTTLDLARGEILTLLGPSGCGKTTTLRMAVGLERATGGEIHFNGRPVDAPERRIFVPPEKRDMGMVFQSYAIWPHMNVHENVAYPLRVRRRPAEEIRREVERVLDLVGLSGFGNRPATRLSGGQQQRVAVARGLIFGPDLLMMDEPFSNLDAKLRDQMRTEVKLLQRRLGISILFVTHDQAEALSLSDQVAVMSEGRVEQVGAPFELYNHPGTAIVRDFLGRNLLMEATVVGQGGDGSLILELAGGARIESSGNCHIRTLGEGSPCTVSIRPEHVGVSATAPAQGRNLLSVRIATLLFLGDHFESSVILPDGKLIDVRLPPLETWQEGQTVSLELPARAVHVWDRGPTDE